MTYGNNIANGAKPLKDIVNYIQNRLSKVFASHIH